MSAPFEFIDYKILRITYDVAVKSKENNDISSIIENEIRLDRNIDDPTIFRLKLNVNVKGEKNICLEIVGFFKWQIDYVEKETENSLVSFGTTILYPYARSAISSISILDGGDPVILPTINPFHMDDQSEEEIILSADTIIE